MRVYHFSVILICFDRIYHHQNFSCAFIKISAVTHYFLYFNNGNEKKFQDSCRIELSQEFCSENRSVRQCELPTGITHPCANSARTKIGEYFKSTKRRLK